MTIIKTLIHKTLILGLVLVSACCGWQCSAAEIRSPQPSWNELNKLYGHEISDPMVIAFVTQYHLKKTWKFDSGSFSPEDQPYSLLFRRNRIECIILHSGPWPKDKEYSTWTTYAQPLPFHLDKSDIKADIAAKFGQPTSPTSQTWVHAEYRLMFVFNEKPASIESVYISKEATKK